MNSYKAYIIVILILATNSILSAQEKKNWEKPAGGIENAQVVIEKDKVIKLRPVSRRFKAIQIEIPQAKPITLTLNLREVKDSLPSLQVIVRPRTMKNPLLDKFYGFNAKLGYGNYKSPYALINYGTKRNDEYMFNTYFNHISSAKGPVADDFSSEYNTSFGASGKYFLNNIVASSNINFLNHNYSFYGYSPIEISNPLFNRDSVRQKLNVISFNIGIADNNLKNSTDHDLNLGINFLKNNHDVSEFYYFLAYSLKFRIGEQMLLNTIIDYTGFTQKSLSFNDISRRFVQLKPVLDYQMDKFTFSVGVNVFNQNDPITKLKNQKEFYFYPVLGVAYQLNNNHEVKIAVSGANEKISLNNLYEENPYISSNTEVNSNINNFAASLRLEGQLLPNLGYKLSYDYKHYDRQMFYTNSAADTAIFDIVYDELGSSVNRLAASLNYVINDQINLTGAAAYNAYTTNGVTEAWHKPVLELDFTTNFTIAKRINGHLTYYLLNGIKAENAAGQTITLATVHDLNLGLNMSITDRAGIFVDLMNIIGSNYQLYNNYPVKGFQVIGGVNFKF